MKTTLLVLALSFPLLAQDGSTPPVRSQNSSAPTSIPAPTELDRLRAQVKALEERLAAQEKVGNIQMSHVIVALNACQQSVHDLLIPPKERTQ